MNATAVRVGRNDPCPCGSGRKYKHCCLNTGAGAGSSSGAAESPLQMAIAHHRAGQIEPAEALYRRALEGGGAPAAGGGVKSGTDGAHAEALFGLGMIARQRGRLDEAVALLSRSLFGDPRNVAAHVNLALAWQARGELERAAASYEDALRLKPDALEALVNLGNVRQMQGRGDEALACYRHAVEATPASSPALAPALCNLANVLHDRGEYDEAIACYRRAAAMMPGSAEILANLGLSLQHKGDIDAALDSYREAIRAEPGHAGAHFNRGLALQLLGRHAEAAESYRAALAARPAHAQSHSNLGNALEQQGLIEEAIGCYRRAIEIDPDLVPAHNGLNSVLAARVPLWHVAMMNDEPRNRAYEDALRAAVTPDTEVFEVGTGAGLLSMMAARLGAKSVVTCEAEPLVAAAAVRVISANGLAARIRVLPKLSTQVHVGRDLERPADLLVSEILSSELLAERVLPSIEDARRRLLRPGGKIIPAAGSIMLALVAGEDFGLNVSAQNARGFDLRPFNGIVSRKQILTRNDLDLRYLSDDVEAFRFDFQNTEFAPEERRLLRVPVLASGLAWGLIQWIRLEMDQSNTFENHPRQPNPASGWQHVFYGFDTPVELREGQTALVRAAHNRVMPWFSLAGVE